MAGFGIAGIGAHQAAGLASPWAKPARPTGADRGGVAEQHGARQACALPGVGTRGAVCGGREAAGGIRSHLLSAAGPDGVRLAQDRGREGKITYRVSVPADGEARKMRDQILARELHYTPADIKALDDATSGKGFYINHNGAETWATPDQVREFPVGRDGETEIPVDASLVENLKAFREDRVRQGAVAGAATAGISDPNVRAEAHEQLTRVLTYHGGARADAAGRLADLAAAGRPASSEVSAALQKLADRPETRGNASLQIAAARASAAQEQVRFEAIYGPKPERPIFTEARTRLAAALAAAQPGGDRGEAAKVNASAAGLYRVLGEPDEAARREMIGRFYQVDDRERTRFQGPRETWLDPTISRWPEGPDGGPSMRAPTPEERRLDEYDRREAERVAARGGSRQPDPSDWRSSVVRTHTPGGFDVEQRRDRGEVYFEEREPMTGQTVQTVVLNERGVRNAETVGGVFALANEVLAYVALYQETQEVARRNVERPPLARAAHDSVRWPVPPRPAEVERIAVGLERAEATTADAQQRSRIEGALRALPTLREASRAFWDERPR